METLETAVAILQTAVGQDDLVSITLSNPRADYAEPWRKVLIRPVQLRGKVMRQWEYHTKGKVQHENRDTASSAAHLQAVCGSVFQQAQVRAGEQDTHIVFTDRGRARVATKAADLVKTNLEHNVKKNYIIPDNEPCAFLTRLGVMTAEGKVIAAKYDKFRQINRFLEMVQDVVGDLPKKRTVNVVDFGCGKSYLTFALYHYLHEVKGLTVHAVGLDLKQDVVAFCSKVATDVGYDGLTFSVGDIESFDASSDTIDLMVSLHACDTATDHALAKAVQWGANIILSVPCCQHELYKQLDNETMRPLLKHGILRERLASLVTDATRGDWLELQGYNVQMLEFISAEHTAKNILIRAVKRRGGSVAPAVRTEYSDFLAFWNIRPTIDGLGGKGDAGC